MKKIAVDIDDVLAVSAQALIDFSNKRWGTNLTVDDYTEDWAKMWGVDHSEELNRSNVWHASTDIHLKQPQEKGLEVLKKLKNKYELVILTSRRKIIQQDTKDWLDKHYKGIFSEIHFSGIWDVRSSVSHTYTKAEMCKEIGADYLIDDQVKHCIGAAEAGVPAILFGDYPWNRRDKIPGLVTRCRDWQAVLEYFDAKG